MPKQKFKKIAIEDLPKENWSKSRQYVKHILFVILLVLLAIFLILTANPADLHGTKKVLATTKFKTKVARQAEPVGTDSSAAFDPCSLPQVTCLDPSNDVSVGDQNLQGTVVEVSAYNLVEWQCDDEPCIGAAGINQCLTDPDEYGVDYFAASNAYPLYTKLEIQNLGTVVIVDRMNSRYHNRIDIEMGQDVERALNFGVQNLKVINI